MEAAPHTITQLLIEWGKGDRAALDQLMPLVYGELRKLARRSFIANGGTAYRPLSNRARNRTRRDGRGLSGHAR
jgi:hypothetical protein